MGIREVNNPKPEPDRSRRRSDSAVEPCDIEFDRLYRRYFVDVKSLCRKLLHDAATAEDVAQETMLRAFRNLDTLGETALWPWLSAIARHLCIDEIRKRVRHQAALDPLRGGRTTPAEPEDPTFHAVASTQDQTRHRRELATAFHSLAERDRAILWQRMEDELSYDEIAARQRVSIASVRNSLWRSRRRLQEMLTDVHAPLVAAFSVALATLRRLAARARSRFEARAPSLACQLQALVACSANALSVGVVVLVAAWAVTPTAFSSPDQFAAMPAKFVGLVASRGVDHRTHVSGSFSSASSGGSRYSAGPVRAGINNAPPHRGGVGPPRSDAQIEIVEPDGQTLFSTENTLTCNEPGKYLLPQDGPVRFVC